MKAMVKSIKELHNLDVCLFLTGNFYYVFGKDADIVSYLFGYKIKEIQDEFGIGKECGFPTTAINKVKAKLEECKINYLVIDRRNNYNVAEVFENKDLNRYMVYYEKGNKQNKTKIRIKNINDFLLNNIAKVEETDILERMEEIIYAKRKF